MTVVKDSDFSCLSPYSCLDCIYEGVQEHNFARKWTASLLQGELCEFQNVLEHVPSSFSKMKQGFQQVVQLFAKFTHE